MSAACALDIAPNTIATNQNLRIATLQSNFQTRDDHRLLTLINRCLAASIGNLAREKAAIE
jgi:hypothetical protein